MSASNSIFDLPIDIKRFGVKTVGSGDLAEDKVEIVILANLDQVDLGSLALIRRGKGVRLSLENKENQLPYGEINSGASTELPGQMSTEDITPAGAPPIYSVSLLSMPLDPNNVKHAEGFLKKLMAMKVAEVRDNLQCLPWTIADKVNAIDAQEIKIGLNALGAGVELVEWPKEETEEDDPTRPHKHLTDDYLNSKIANAPMPPAVMTAEEFEEYEQLVAEKQVREPGWKDPMADDIAFQQTIAQQSITIEGIEQGDEQEEEDLGDGDGDETDTTSEMGDESGEEGSDEETENLQEAA